MHVLTEIKSKDKKNIGDETMSGVEQRDSWKIFWQGCELISLGVPRMPKKLRHSVEIALKFLYCTF